MKVLFIHYSSDICGGSDRSLFELIKTLNKKLITPVMILKNTDPLIKDYAGMGVKIYSLDLNAPPKKIFSKRTLLFLITFLPSILAMLKIIKKENPEVIHVNTSLNIQGGLSAYLSKTPLVWHIREILGKGALDLLVKKAVCILSTKTIAISKAVQENFQCLNTSVVYNGMDLSEYIPLNRNIEKKQITISCIGRFEEWKGQHVLVEAIAQVKKKYKNIRVQFIGGPASSKPEYLENLRKRIQTLKLEENIAFKGIRNDIPAILVQTDILVVPTATSEPFGRVVIEGMASGCVVIATSAGGPSEIIDDEKTGYLVTPGSVNELSIKLIEVIGNIDNITAIGRKAKKTVFEQYDIKRVALEIEQVLLDLKQ